MPPTRPPFPLPLRDTVWQLEDGRTLTAGVELHTSALRGRWRFVAHVVGRDTDWLDVYGPLGPRGRPRVRSIPPDSVTTIHRDRTPSRVDIVTPVV